MNKIDTMKILKYSQLNESADDKRLNIILDKITKFGYENLSDSDREYLNTQNTGSSQHSKLLMRLLYDLDNGEVNDAEFKQFINKFISKDELADFILQIFYDKRIDYLVKK